MAATLEYEQLNKNLEIVDGHAVKAPRITRTRNSSIRRWSQGSGNTIRPLTSPWWRRRTASRKTRIKTR